jgi:formylglycine-generating enzyme required for sulfatase activity
VEDGGYNNRKWWSAAGWTWLQDTGVTEPEYWRNRRWNAPNQPVVGVSFWEAEACCAWASGRLPEDREWEAMARGHEGCEYPWCGEWEDGICNTREANLPTTSPVGLFPRSRQAKLGIEDLAGNVWEWCATIYEGALHLPGDPRVLRGGAWGFDQFFARGMQCYRYYPDVRVFYIGFRAVYAPTSAR